MTDRRTDRRTDRQTDGQADSSIPPLHYVAGGIKTLNLTDQSFIIKVAKQHIGHVVKPFTVCKNSNLIATLGFFFENVYEPTFLFIISLRKPFYRNITSTTKNPSWTPYHSEISHPIEMPCPFIFHSFLLGYASGVSHA